MKEWIVRCGSEFLHTIYLATLPIKTYNHSIGFRLQQFILSTKPVLLNSQNVSQYHAKVTPWLFPILLEREKWFCTDLFP